MSPILNSLPRLLLSAVSLHCNLVPSPFKVFDFRRRESEYVAQQRILVEPVDLRTSQPIICFKSSLQLLSKMDLDLLAVDREGSTPAHLAAAEGHLECLRLLVYHKRKAVEVLNCRNNNVSIPECFYHMLTSVTSHHKARFAASVTMKI